MLSTVTPAAASWDRNEPENGVVPPARAMCCTDAFCRRDKTAVASEVESLMKSAEPVSADNVAAWPTVVGVEAATTAVVVPLGNTCAATDAARPEADESVFVVDVKAAAGRAVIVVAAMQAPTAAMVMMVCRDRPRRR